LFQEFELMLEQRVGNETKLDNGLSPDAPVALVDMDGTLCDCSGALARELAALRAPSEGTKEDESSEPPAYIAARRRLIMSAPGFWRNLQPLQLGFEIVGLLQELGFTTYVLTKGPREHSVAWMEKVDWCRQYVPHLPIVITEDKGIVHGAVLVEDWPPYASQWLRACPQGLVIVPAQPWNANVDGLLSTKAIRYDGSNINAIRRRLETAIRKGHTNSK
jgi:5'-nucleotidase